MSDVEISVVAPVRNGVSYLPRFFNSLEAQTLNPSRFEVVLVDDASTDATAELAYAWSSRDPARRHVVRGTGRGPAAARNVGIAAARGEWVASTDADVAADPGWLENAIAALERTSADAIEGAIDSLASEARTIYTTRQQNLTGGRYMTGNMIYRRSLLEQLGGFDEQFAEQFLEDSDLAFRILDAGYEIPFASDAIVRHPVLDVPPLQVLRNMTRVQWLALFAAKHPERYRSQLRPLVQPLSSIDIDVLLALGALATLPKARGTGRVVLGAVAANGLKRGVLSRARGASPHEVPGRLAMGLAVPSIKAMSWLAGCARFKSFVW